MTVVETRERAGAYQSVVRGGQTRDGDGGAVLARVVAELEGVDGLLGDDAFGGRGQLGTEGGGH